MAMHEISGDASSSRWVVLHENGYQPDNLMITVWHERGGEPIHSVVSITRAELTKIADKVLSVSPDNVPTEGRSVPSSFNRGGLR